MSDETPSMRRGIPPGMPARTDLTWTLVTALVIGVAGLAPHLFYSFATGELAYFKSSADEEFYALYSTFVLGDEGYSPWRRSIVLNLLHGISGKNIEATLIAADFVFPVVTFLAAYWFSTLFFNGRAAIAAALVLLFAQEFLSFGSLAVFNGVYPVSLPAIRSYLPPWALPFLPDYTTYYFGIYRTPEPQISWAGLFVALRLLLSAWSGEARDNRRRLGIWAAHAVAPFLYTYCMVGVLVFSGALAVLSALKRDFRTFIDILVGLLIAGAVFLAVLAMSPDIAALQTNILYSSRLPTVSASQIYALALLAALAWLRATGRLADKDFSIALAAAVTPLVLMNYQLIAGTMISARDWERNINFVFVGIAGFVAAKAAFANVRRDLRRKAATGVVLVVLAVLVLGQRTVWGMFLHYNDLVTAATRALSLTDNIAKDDRIYLEDVTWESLVEIRMQRRLPFSLHFVDTYLTPPRSPLAENGTAVEAGTTYQEDVFEHLDHVGVTPSGLADSLIEEVAQGYGTFLGWFFHFRDWWYPASDSRTMRKAAIRKAIPAIVSAYRDYLSNPRVPAGRCWLLTRRPPDSMSPAERSRNVPVGTGQGVFDESPAVSLYRQTDCG